MPLEVVISGGSLCGLFAGIILKRLGHNVQILERDPCPRLHDQGAGIVADQEISQFMRLYDLTQKPYGVISRSHIYLDRSGNQVSYKERFQHLTSWDLLYNVLRANYDAVSSSYCQAPEGLPSDGPAVYSYGHTVLDFRKVANDKIEITYEGPDGRAATKLADVLIGADGPSSTLRNLVSPETVRSYVGYVAWRGTVVEEDLVPATAELFAGRVVFFHSEGLQIIIYTIPGQNGSLEVGKRLVNFVWYCNYPETSQEYANLMTDLDGKRHRTTVPIGKIQPEQWQKQKSIALDRLPRQMAEVVTKTTQPFVQSITDVLASSNVFHDGKILLIGDSVAGFRPHTGAAASQAAFHAMKLAELYKGSKTLREWSEETLSFSTEMQQIGVRLGQESQYGHHRFAE